MKKEKITYRIIYIGLFLFAEIFIFIPASPQNRADSLRKILSQSSFLNDSNKVDLLYQISKATTGIEKIKYLEEALLLAEKINFEKEVDQCAMETGSIYFLNGKSAKALEYFFKVLRIREEKQDTADLALIYNSIGAAYSDMREYPKALQYYFKSLELRQKQKDIVAIGQTLNNIGLVYHGLNDTANAFLFYNKAIKAYGEGKSEEGVATVLNNMGVLYASTGMNNKALELFNKSLNIKRKINFRYGIPLSLLSIARSYQRTGRIKEAIASSEEAFSIGKEFDNIYVMEKAAELLSKLYQTRKDFERALMYYEIFKQMSDTNISIETRKGVFKAEMQYEFDKKEQAIKLEQEKKDALAEAERKKQQIIIGALGIGTTIVMLLAGFIFRALRITRKQKHIIDKKNKYITDSINYAKRIQDAILPSHEELSKYFSDSFIFFLPKDIVSGDFYWLSSQNRKTIFAVADCTGHGVPGAFMSMIGNTLLNEIVNEKKIFQPAEILNHLNKGIVLALHQESRSQDDGMDISVCLLDKENNKLIFAGANHSMYVVSENSIQEIKGDIYSIGSMFGKKDISFVQKEISLQKDFTLYFLTDGFVDQVGERNGKKFLVKQLQKLLLSVSSLAIPEQEQVIKKTFTEWKGTRIQQDDVLLIGIKI